MMERYQLGNVTLEIDCPILLTPSERMDLFRVEETKTEKVIRIHCFLENYKLPDGAKPYMTRLDSDYYHTDQGEVCVHTLMVKGEKKALHWLLMRENQSMEFYISPQTGKEYHTMHEMLKHMELISALIRQNMWVLHSCYVKTDFGAILFTANSGVGKSTQGKLWELCDRGEIINEDRALLYEDEGCLKAAGFVYSGSSQICKNVTCPVAAIVVVKQADVNRVSKMKIGPAVRNLYMQLVCNPQRDEEKEKKLDFASQLVGHVDVLQLECRPDAEAVQVLEDYMMRE